MKTNRLTATIFALLFALTAMAQNSKPATPSPNETSIPPAPLPDPQSSPATAQPATPSGQPPSLPSPSAAQAGDSVPVSKNEIRMNFQETSLADVLNYLSEAAGFVIVQEVPVSGTVNIVCKRPINADEAVDLLNTVLVEKGYTAIHNGRILKIISSHDAQKHDLPVVLGSDPEKIPRKDGMVTQILPLRFVEAGKLIENLRPLLAADATISSNENSNAILLTDTQTNIHRIAEIIHSLDNSISSISTIHVYALRYADAKDFANVLTQLFNPDQSAGNWLKQNAPQAFAARFVRGGGDNGANAAPASEARKAASRVIAVADEQSNSVIVSAPDEYMATISEIVSRLDTSTTDITETRIFRLEHADSMELAGILNSLYGDTTTGNTTGAAGRNGNNQRPGGQQAGRPQNNPQNSGNQPSERTLLQARVVAVPDPRTNSIIVNASKDTMEQIALTIGRLDASDSKKQHVYVHVLEHADPDNVATVLRGMFGNQGSASGANQPASNALNQRTSTGASSDISNTLNTNSNNSRSRASGR